MKYEIPFANVYLTRKCNLKCHYCNVWKSTSVYPDMKYYNENEKDLEWWKKFFKDWHDYQPNTFFSILGGEPLIVPWLPDLVNYLNELGTLYTIITNCTLTKQLENLINNVKFIRGFTASVDVIQGEYDDDRAYKSQIGLNTLIMMKEKYKNKIDCTAEVTLNAYNLKYAVNLIKVLNKYNIYASVSVIDPKLSEYYDFSNIEYNDTTFVQKTDETKRVFDDIRKYDNIHMPKLLDLLYEDLPYSKHDIRDLLGYPSIDSDGKVRYSLRIRGVIVPNGVTYLDLLKYSNGQSNINVYEMYKMDQEKYDLGFNWSGIYMAKTIRLGLHNDHDKNHGLWTADIS